MRYTPGAFVVGLASVAWAQAASFGSGPRVWEASRRQSVRRILPLTAILPVKLADNVEDGATVIHADRASPPDTLADRPQPTSGQLGEP
jgi:hypothetical protein